MKATGICRRIDDLGRIVIPREIRHRLHLYDGDMFEFYLENESIILQKYNVTSDAKSAIGSTIRFIETDNYLDDKKKEEIAEILNKALEVLKR